MLISAIIYSFERGISSSRAGSPDASEFTGGCSFRSASVKDGLSKGCLKERSSFVTANPACMKAVSTSFIGTLFPCKSKYEKKFSASAAVGCSAAVSFCSAAAGSGCSTGNASAGSVCSTGNASAFTPAACCQVSNIKSI